ncbi:prepilin-type N-terminal cleavage/methylation domain-containing protein [Candidatus Nomurabacteria bacterium]|nr:prepilin-type N-terminal cleavage/methylation domain-containing protein [Candidatus Nomurabacteria bacterium]
MRSLGKKQSGFTLVETLVGVFVFLIIALGIYQGFASILALVQASRARTVASLLASEQVEIIRNLPYQQVGVVNGIPNGVLPHVQVFARGGITFTATTTVRNVDDPFDGTIGGNPNDINPADYKIVEVLVNCSICKLAQPLAFTTSVGPKSLETGSGNGALFIQVLDASGLPVAGADIHIENNQAGPAIVINDLTNNAGMLQLVDVPPGNLAYEISVTKSGYTSNQTRLPGAVGNPNPTIPHSTVLAGQVTQITLPIDLVSQFNFKAIRSNCSPVGSAAFNLRGDKLLGTSPSVYNYDQNHTLDGSGQRIVNNLEWDAYRLSITDAGYDLAGSVPLLPLTLPPNTEQDVSLVLASKSSNAVLITVKDSASGLPLADVSVELKRGSYDQTLLTDRGFFRQTDWSGGSGQTDSVDSSQYFSDDGNVDTAGLLGQLRLRSVFGNYAPSGVLTSSTFDTGSDSESNFYNLSWNPSTQIGATTSLRFQIATTQDSATSTWDYLGPDGTADTYYTVSGESINPVHSGDRFLRYRVYLSTTDTAMTPALADVAVTYGSGCLPFGQVFFNGLVSASDYDLTVSKSGYQTYHNDAVSLTNPWQSLDIPLLLQ